MTAGAAGGLVKISEGWTSEIFAVSATRVLKLYRRGFAGIARVECTKMRCLRNHTSLVPEVHVETSIDGREGYFMERIEAAALGSQPGRCDEEIAELLFSVQRRILALPSGPEFPDAGERIVPRLESIRPMYGALVEESLSVVAESRNDNPVLCHGDFHAGNVLVGADGPRVIDWNGAAVGPLESEVAKSLLLMAAAPATLAWSPALFDRRTRITKLYWSLVAEAGIVNRAYLSQWLLVRIVEFFALPVPELHAALRPYLAKLLRGEALEVDDLWTGCAVQR